MHLWISLVLQEGSSIFRDLLRHFEEHVDELVAVEIGVASLALVRCHHTVHVVRIDQRVKEREVKLNYLLELTVLCSPLFLLSLLYLLLLRQV